MEADTTHSNIEINIIPVNNLYKETLPHLVIEVGMF